MSHILDFYLNNNIILYKFYLYKLMRCQVLYILFYSIVKILFTSIKI